MDEPVVIGLDLGGTSVKGVAVTVSGIELARDQRSFQLEERGAFITATKELLKDLQSRAGRRPAGVGISAPGIAAKDQRSIAFMPGRFEGLEGLLWSEVLLQPEVPVLNDAQAALLGEVWLGAARGCRDVLLLTLGTGVGGAVMSDGRVLRGHSGKAGHLGHVSLNPDGEQDITHAPGSLEDAIGNHSIRVRTEGRYNTTHELVRAHQAGDPIATDVWLKSVRALAAALASFTNILDPERIIIGGGIARCGDALFGPLREWVGRFEWKICGHEVQIVPAELGEMAGAYGAAYQAVSRAESGRITPG